MRQAEKDMNYEDIEVKPTDIEKVRHLEEEERNGINTEEGRR